MRDKGRDRTRVESLEEAMGRFSAGEDAAFGRVYALAWEPVVRALVCATHNRALAEDVAQETFLKIFAARDSYRQGARVLPWARTIARRTLIDTVRRQTLERAFAKTAAASSVESHGRTDERLDAKRAATRTLDALAQLPPRQAQALELVTTDGATVVDIARRLGETALAVRLRVHRARACLRLQLSDFLDDAA
ncbi:MAG: sigma-70 family RNA polymerase sigma factor [Polyangiaceae bacterium]